MKPIPVEKQRFRQDRALMMMDDAEMALELIDLAQTTTVADGRGTPGREMELPDLNMEYTSALSMIMDREEWEAVAKEVEAAQRGPARAA